ncbi:MAG: MarR family transcriptional regulator [Pseudomonadota bacterium]
MKSFSQKKIIKLFEQEAAILFPRLSIKQIVETSTDFKAKINIENNTYLFILLVCKRPYPSEMNSLLKRVKTKEGNYLFVGTYFPPGTQATLEKEGVNFLDLSGNCSINVFQHNTNQKHDVHIQISGKQNLYPFTESLKNIFSGKSSRIIRTLLETYPQKLKPSELAKMCHVSPSLVTKVIDALEQQSFITREDGISLVDPGLLLELWADNYSFRKNNIETKILINKPLNEIMQFFKHNENYILTRTAASSLIAPFADYQVIEAYHKGSVDITSTWEKLDALLVRGNSGENVKILEPYDEGIFDFSMKIDGFYTVGLIQLYLDLYSDPKRGKEQATFLREEKLKF